MAQAVPDPALAVARDGVNAAWASVTATWVGVGLSVLVLVSAFVTILLQRYLDREKAERRRQYNNLSVLVSSLLTINYVEFMREYIDEAIRDNNIVSKYPVIFQLGGYTRDLDISSTSEEVGPGPTGVASRAIAIAREVVEKVRQTSPGDTLTLAQLEQTRDFITAIRPDIASVWEALSHHYQNISSSSEGRWAVEEFCRRSRTRASGRQLMDQLQAGRYATPVVGKATL